MLTPSTTEKGVARREPDPRERRRGRRRSCRHRLAGGRGAERGHLRSPTELPSGVRADGGHRQPARRGPCAAVCPRAALRPARNGAGGRHGASVHARVARRLARVRRARQRHAVHAARHPRGSAVPWRCSTASCSGARLRRGAPRRVRLPRPALRALRLRRGWCSTRSAARVCPAPPRIADRARRGCARGGAMLVALIAAVVTLVSPYALVVVVLVVRAARRRPTSA